MPRTLFGRQFLRVRAARIRDLARKLNYRPNAAAKTVSTDGNAFAAVPADLPAVAAAVATAMGVDVAVVAGAATANARRGFGDGEGVVW